MDTRPTLRELLTEFVTRERAILDVNRRIRAGEKLQTTGAISSVTPSVVSRLEWMLENSKD
jgi:hypothetical protein